MQAKDTVPTHHWHLCDDGRIQCDICPRACQLREGQRGLCFVRARQDDQIVLTTYGRSSGFCIDPIEKKPLNHFLPGTPVLSFGTAGCNLSCRFCQNWDISKSREMDRLMDSASPQALAQAALEHRCKSVAFTYNDPVIFMEYAIDVAKACHEVGVKSVAVSAGYMCAEPRAEFYHHMDAANIDLKAFTEDFYHKLTGAHLAPVLETIAYIKHETSTWLELTTLLIPGHNDSDEELQRMTQWVVEHLGPNVPMHFSAFHPDWKMRDTPATPYSTLVRARRIALENGVRYAYTGNIPSGETDSTHCHRCQAIVIGRCGYTITAWALTTEGSCSRCGAVCAGVFAAKPGSWGSRRQPVRIDAST